ncbi:transposase [Lactiplantibacillus plantarum]|uniref:transposase n=1 Tax=Lactiplantibacillus plantarum TaxID=1590 RepID=UPI00374E1D67
MSEALHTDLKQKGIWFWTPYRKNMKQRTSDETLLKRQRRRIETVFSQLCCLFNIEHHPARSYSGIQDRLEQCLFIDTWFKIN